MSHQQQQLSAADQLLLLQQQQLPQLHHINNRPVKCGLCQQLFPKSVIRTAITKKSVLEVLQAFSRQTGIKSGHVNCDDDDEESDDENNNNHDHDEDHKNVSPAGRSSASSTAASSRSPSPNHTKSFERPSSSSSSPAQNKNNKKRSPTSRRRGKGTGGKNPASSPSSIYAPVPICKFCGQFFGVYDVPLSEEQAATAIELGVPLLELTKGTKAPKKKNNNNNINGGNYSPGSSARRNRRKNQSNNSISPRKMTTPEKVNETNNNANNNSTLNNNNSNVHDSPPLQRKGTMSMSTLGGENINNNNTSNHPEISPVHSEDSLIAWQQSTSSSKQKQRQQQQQQQPQPTPFEIISKSKLFQKYNAGRSSMAASSKDLLTRKPGISTGGISYEQYLNNNPSDENPTPPPSSSQAMKLASALLKRELHKLQAARFRETISKIDAQTRAYLQTSSGSSSKNVPQNSSLRNSTTTPPVTTHAFSSPDHNNPSSASKGVRFSDCKNIQTTSPVSKNNSKKNSDYEDDFENDDDDSDGKFEVSSSDDDHENVAKENKITNNKIVASSSELTTTPPSASISQLNTTQTPDQARAATKAKKNQKHQEEQKERDEHVENNKIPTTTATSTTLTTVKKGERRFQIAMDRVENLVQHLLKSGENKTNKNHHFSSSSSKIIADDQEYEINPEANLGGGTLNNTKSKDLLTNTPNNSNKKNNIDHSRESLGELTSPPSSSKNRTAIHARKQEKYEQQQADELVRAIAQAKNARNDMK